MKTRITNTVNHISPILGIGFLGIIIFMLVWPFKTVTVVQPMKILTPEVKAGDIIRYEIDYCRYIETDSSISWILIPTDESYDGDYLGSRESGACQPAAVS